MHSALVESGRHCLTAWAIMFVALDLLSFPPPPFLSLRFKWLGRVPPQRMWEYFSGDALKQSGAIGEGCIAGDGILLIGQCRPNAPSIFDKNSLLLSCDLSSTLSSGCRCTHFVALFVFWFSELT